MNCNRKCNFMRKHKKSMLNFISLANSLSLLLPLPFLYWAFTRTQSQLKQTNLIVYVHDHFSGPQTSAVTVAGKDGSDSNILNFGSIAVVDDLVTEGPDPESKQLGRAQGLYVNSQLDGKGIYLSFSVIFNDGQYKGSTLEIQGYDLLALKEREFSIVSGTGYFRFVRGYGIMTTEFIDLPSMQAIIKLDIIVHHY